MAAESSLFLYLPVDGRQDLPGILFDMGGNDRYASLKHTFRCVLIINNMINRGRVEFAREDTGEAQDGSCGKPDYYILLLAGCGRRSLFCS